MEVWVDIAKTFGPSAAILVAVLVYHAKAVEKHAKVIEKKDAEIARVQELRVKESKDVSDKMIEHDNKSMTTLHGVDKTLSMLIDRIR